MTVSVTDRIIGCLQGIATGDAIGKQTETLSHAKVGHWYPSGVRGFEHAPGSVIPRYQGNTKHEWRVGETTDDTERTLAVARAIVQDEGVSRIRVAEELLGCSKSVHPGVRSLWEFHEAADPARIAVRHDGCGAAIRVSPVGMLHVSSRLEQIVADAREVALPTHGGSLAIAAAAATAAAVSAAIDGACQAEIAEVAVLGAELAEDQWSDPEGRSLATALSDLYEDLASWGNLSAATVASAYFPEDPLTIVPLAIVLGTIMGSAEGAILLAANVGGDSDSVASIAGAILGARAPETINQEWCEVVEQVNHHDVTSVGRTLARMRH